MRLGLKLVQPENHFMDHEGVEGQLPGYAQQPGWETGASQLWKRIVVWRLLYQLVWPALISPLLRYQLKGHHSVVGQLESSESVHRPQWQFSIE